MLKLRQSYMLSHLPLKRGCPDPLMLETDAINIRTTLTSHVYDLSLIGMVIKDIKYLMFTESLRLEWCFSLDHVT
jgi:hypothetical protein